MTATPTRSTTGRGAEQARTKGVTDGRPHYPTASRFTDVGARARGNWPAILSALGIDADRLRNRHGPCPGCGGHDRFRFDDRDGRGTWYCGGGGNPESGDGFDLLCHVHGYARKDALHAVSGWLGDDVLRPKPEAVKTPPPKPVPVWTATLPVPPSA